MLTYELMKKHPKLLEELLRKKLDDFEYDIQKIKPKWDETYSRSSTAGRTSQLKQFEDQLLCFFLYISTFLTYFELGELMDLHNANVCRLVKKFSNVVDENTIIFFNPSLKFEKVVSIINRHLGYDISQNFLRTNKTIEMVKAINNSKNTEITTQNINNQLTTPGDADEEFDDGHFLSDTKELDKVLSQVISNSQDMEKPTEKIK